MIPRMAAGVLAVSVAFAVAPASADPVRDGQFWIGQLGLERAWQLSKGTGVTIGLVDTGVNADLPDLTDAVLPGREFPELGAGPRDEQGHGTEMALLIAGRGHNDSDGTLGVAPEAKILPAKLNGGGTDVNSAIRWVVDHGATVVNLSLGSGTAHTADYDDGLRYAQEHDVVVVAAAGNSRTDRGVTSPADRPGVLAVSAVDRTGAFRPEVSVQGPEVALAAPGVDLTTANSPRASRGTSEAAALVSGVAALVRARFPKLTAANVVARLTGTAARPGGRGRDEQYGFGVVDPVGALTADVPPVDRNPLGTLVERSPTTVEATGRPVWPWVAGGLVALAAALGTIVFLRRQSAK
ncbi:S8 family serine peptidase [Solihabitans fulvus]|uniref:S8 family serine peptidase n=1 Tax=Solihabitans fulvus TaxID=1892852 RepID=UPI0016621AFF|nr:S8 family serine peptidase [Solihabitans fulvus]